MAETKAVPAIIRMRAERILKTAAKTAYRVDAGDANLLKVIMPDDKVRYVNLAQGREIKSTELKVTLVDDGEQAETQKETKEVKAISRADVQGKERSNKPKSKTATKKTRTKK